MAIETTQIGIPLDEFIRLYDEEGPFELFDGERKLMSPPVAGHIVTTRESFLAIYNFITPHQLGEVFTESVFVVDYTSNWVTNSRVPDVAYYEATRLATYKQQTPDWLAKPFILVPDLVIEVVSPNDRYSELNEKVARYLLDGVRMVWVLDPQQRSANVHRPSSDQITHLTENDTLSGEDVIPGFEVPLAQVLP